MAHLRIGSRGSLLAMWQARWVEARLKEFGHTVEIEVIKTTGDKITGVALSQLGANTGTKGLFTKEIEDALSEGRVDLAVHSLKDMPTELPAGLVLSAIPVREDARDAILGRRLGELARGARIGTSSLRRAAQLRAMRPDIEVESLRGNLDTRIRKLDQGRYDAIVLAAAGLKRLGWADRITELIPYETMCPSVGQGALAIETRSGGGEGEEAARRLEHPETRAAITAERALLARLGGGCQVPIGAHAEVRNSSLHLRAVVVSPDGAMIVRRETTGPRRDAVRIGGELAQELLDAGASEILEAVYGE